MVFLSTKKRKVEKNGGSAVPVVVGGGRQERLFPLLLASTPKPGNSIRAALHRAPPGKLPPCMMRCSTSERGNGVKLKYYSPAHKILQNGSLCVSIFL